MMFNKALVAIAFAATIANAECTDEFGLRGSQQDEMIAECGMKSKVQSDYRGYVNTTRTGRQCQRWDSQAPQKHTRTPPRYPSAGLEDNYCRNPDGEDKAWCYTTDPDKRWEYCDIPMCQDDPDDDSPPTYTGCGSTWVDNQYMGQSDYRGTISKTVSGRTCQKWDDQAPHKHHRYDQRYPYAGLDENYCRNPDDEPQAWCYTTDPDKRWEYCDVPKCDEGPPSAPSMCFDYTEAIDLGIKQCSGRKVYEKIRDIYRTKSRAPGAPKCRGGLERDLMALTRTTSVAAAHQALQDMCDSALQEASDNADESTWKRLQDEGKIDFNEYYEGTGFLNDQTGNFQQEENDFTKRGGSERFIYMGDDPRKNDYLSTTEESYNAGQVVSSFYSNEARLSFLKSPLAEFDEGSCPETLAAVCCWHRDRQYFDNNGNCNQNDCVNQNPGDNTDLCWIKDGETLFPYPGAETEQALHCHGYAWAQENLAPGDTNSRAKNNNLFYVSMYDHMYQRGYVNSITDDEKIHGDQPMCACVEDMNPVARADCTEVIGRTNYTAYQDGPGGPYVIKPVAGSFSLEFRACEGYDYVEDFGPEEYAANPNAAELEASNNDLAAFRYRQYIEGKVTKNQTEAFEKTIIGYRDPSVNDGDAEREIACKAAFEREYPGQAWEENTNATTASE